MKQEEAIECATQARAFCLKTGCLAACWLLVSSIAWGLASYLLDGDSPHLPFSSQLNYGALDGLASLAFFLGWSLNAYVALALILCGQLSTRASQVPLYLPIWVVRLSNLILFFCAVKLLFKGPEQALLYGLSAEAFAALGVLYTSFAFWCVLTFFREKPIFSAADHYLWGSILSVPIAFLGAYLACFAFTRIGLTVAVASHWFTAILVWNILLGLGFALAYALLSRELKPQRLPSASLASVGFYLLIFLGPWAFFRDFIGGATPVWVGACGLVGCILLLGQALIVAINLLPHLWKLSQKTENLAYAFLGTAILLYLGLVGLQAFYSTPKLLATFALSHWDIALRHQLSYAGASFLFFGSFYALLKNPKQTTRDFLGTLHYLAALLGLCLLMIISVALSGLWSTPLLPLLKELRTLPYLLLFLAHLAFALRLLLARPHLSNPPEQQT